MLYGQNLIVFYCGQYVTNEIHAGRAAFRKGQLPIRKAMRRSGYVQVVCLRSRKRASLTLIIQDP